jgi:predicted nucleic acid-binding protein
MEDVRLMIEARGLYAKGIGLVDANLLASCLATPGSGIWTLDSRLGKVAEALGIRVDARQLVN